MTDFLKMWPIVAHSFGFFIVLAVLVASFAVWKQARLRGMSEEKVIDMFILAGFSLIVVGRLAYVGFHPQLFFMDLGRVVLFLKYPGFSFPVGLFGAGLVIILASKLNNFAIWEMLDIFSYGVIFATFLSLVGCNVTTCSNGVSGTTMGLLVLAIIQVALVILVPFITRWSPQLFHLQKRSGAVFLCYLIFSLLSLLMLSAGKRNETYLFCLGLSGALILFIFRYREVFLWSNFPVRFWDRLRAIWKTGGKN